jgi:hypothetical protein
LSPARTTLARLCDSWFCSRLVLTTGAAALPAQHDPSALPAGIDSVEDAAQAYLHHTDGNPSEALRLAVADVVTLNHLAVLVGEGVSWGFLRRARADLIPSPS